MSLKDLDHKLSVKESEELRKQLELYFELADYRLEFVYDFYDKLGCYVIVWDDATNEVVVDTKNFFGCFHDSLLYVMLFNFILYNDARIGVHLGNHELERKIKNGKPLGNNIDWKPFKFGSYSEFAMQLALRCGQ